MTERPTATGAPGADDPPRPDDPPSSQLQAPATAVLDEAHLGDIEGAFGRVKVGDIGERHSWRRRLLTFAAVTYRFPGPTILSTASIVRVP